MVKCIDCRRCFEVAVSSSYRLWECSITHFILDEGEVVEERACAYFDPKRKFSDKEEVLYQILKMAKGYILVDSFPDKFKGALGRLKQMGLIEIDEFWIKTKTPDHRVSWKRVKGVKLKNEV